jgi:hypothetical protein
MHDSTCEIYKGKGKVIIDLKKQRLAQPEFSQDLMALGPYLYPSTACNEELEIKLECEVELVSNTFCDLHNSTGQVL